MIYSFVLILFSLVLYLNGYDGIEIVEVDTLNAHNFYRKRHGVLPLKISSKLNEVSQNWANHLADIDEMKHRPDSNYGENIYAIWPVKKFPQLGTKAVDAWYNEVKYFDFNASETKMSSSNKAFHLTQVLWKNSKILGQGAARSKSNTIYVVCNYDPPGNIIGRFKKNVFPRKIAHQLVKDNRNMSRS